MKVYRNQLYENFPMVESGIPIRLEIASRILAGLCIPTIPGAHNSVKQQASALPEHALTLADALIDAHNATSGEEGE